MSEAIESFIGGAFISALAFSVVKKAKNEQITPEGLVESALTGGFVACLPHLIDKE